MRACCAAAAACRWAAAVTGAATAVAAALQPAAVVAAPAAVFAAAACCRCFWARAALALRSAPQGWRWRGSRSLCCCGAQPAVPVALRNGVRSLVFKPGQRPHQSPLPV